MNYVSTYWTSFIRSCCYPLGQPIDEKGPINTKLMRFVESRAPSIIVRTCLINHRNRFKSC